MRSPRFCRTDTPRDAHFAFLSYTPFPHPYLSFISNLPPSPRVSPPHPATTPSPVQPWPRY
jgi:hypothetical protein